MAVTLLVSTARIIVASFDESDYYDEDEDYDEEVEDDYSGGEEVYDENSSVCICHRTSVFPLAFTQ